MNIKTSEWGMENFKKLFLAYVVLIFVLSVMYIGDSAVLNNTFIISFRTDHVLHALAFVPWAFFCVKLNKKLLPWFAFGMLYAVCAEGVQYLIPYRSFNINDMLANVLGVVTGFCIFVPLRKIVNGESCNL